MKTIITGLLIFLFATSLYAADSYLCITELATGFSFNKKTKKWSETNFKINEKYIIKEVKNKNYKWGIFKHGTKHLYAKFKSGFDQNGFLTCKGFRNIQMNKQTMRFTIFNTAGYVVTKKYLGYGGEGTQQPYIIIGKCSAL